MICSFILWRGELGTKDMQIFFFLLVVVNYLFTAAEKKFILSMKMIDQSKAYSPSFVRGIIKRLKYSQNQFDFL